MIDVATFMKSGDQLVPIADFRGPIANERYVEGAIELTIDGTRLLTREQVDYVDQLWDYLLEGLECTAEGIPFSTYFPDMPIRITFTPEGGRVTLTVDNRRHVVSATVPSNELLKALVPAATDVFQRLLPLLPEQKPVNEHALDRLSRLPIR